MTLFMTPTAIHVHPVQDRSMRSTWQLYRCQYHESICIQFCIHCFCNIPQTTEFYFVASIPQEYPPPLYFQTFPPWPLPRPPRPRLSSRLARRVTPPERPLIPERTSVRTTVRSLLLLSLSVLQDVRSTRRMSLLLLLTCSQDARLPAP